MKRVDLIRHLERHGCELMREGGNHTIYVNRAAKKSPPFRGIAKSSNLPHRKYARTWEFRVRE